MINTLLLLLAVTSSEPAIPPLKVWSEQLALSNQLHSQIPPIYTPLNQIENMLHAEGNNLSTPVINKVITALKCVSNYNLVRNNIITIIDYSLPSNQKRLWVFDLNEKKLLFHTYVSHGIKSGTLFTNYFSNKNDSKASSIGVYKTEESYYGREGLSLRLEGLDKNFNDNAANRYIVMHGGWYMDENFIKRYGRPGRSWGCPAVPLELYEPIINTIKENSLLVVYYPNDDWFSKSKFLTCTMPSTGANLLAEPKPLIPNNDLRDEVLFAEINTKNPREEGTIVAMSADSYERVFHTQAPLERMLRRQINNVEYVALSTTELNRLVQQGNKEGLNAINFITPFLVMSHGYYETQMKIIPMGTIKEVRLNEEPSGVKSTANYVVNFETKPAIHLKPTNRFIRWLGL